jgi:hypothetical protein
MKSRDFFYTIEPKYKKVSKEELLEFVKKYPRKLEIDVTGISEPPLLTYNDFELANRWPYSVIAKYYCYDDDPNGYYYAPEEERTYKIMENYEEVFNSKTGNKAEKEE